MAATHFSSIEITSVVFLAIFTILFIPSVYIWITYLRAGYHWRYGFWGAFILCSARLACFIAELVFYSSNYTNTSAAIAYIVTLSIGYIGLLETESALFVSWAESHIEFNPTQQQFHGKIRLLNIVGLGLVVYGSSNIDSRGHVEDSALACIQAGTIIFLVLTVIQSAYVAFGWVMYWRRSNTLAILSVTMLALYVRIIFGVYSTFHREVSMITFRDSNVKYLVGCTLVPETIALILLILLGFINIRSKNFKTLPPKRPGDAPEAYDVDGLALEARKQGQVVGERV
ncbi:hypothetical protein TWF106_008640 [Orbilia oligospora]|uniref:DUF7702 domain-containing protein n=2 Tax=Orbilia oligospora TaxID=2813651 RepID=A0A7C8TY90_ORBOL|nr:hypothetical protein TWF788_006883 [Orbilia oligospora]KAF3215630.1 hypothetical protein TWF106_008640 [Orbilia oligospora]